MLEQKMQTIKSLLNSLQNFFSEDQEAKKQVYFKKLEQTLDLTIKVFQKYGKETTHVYEFYDKSETFYNYLYLEEEEPKWKIECRRNTLISTEYITTKELVKYCWENQMDLKKIITSLFDYINQFFSKKQQIVTKEKEKYNTEISCLDEAIVNLEEIINIDISEDIKNK